MLDAAEALPHGGGVPSPSGGGVPATIMNPTLMDAIATAPIKTPIRIIFFLSTSLVSKISVILNRSCEFFFLFLIFLYILFNRRRVFLNYNIYTLILKVKYKFSNSLTYLHFKKKWARGLARYVSKKKHGLTFARHAKNREFKPRRAHHLYKKVLKPCH